MLEIVKAIFSMVGNHAKFKDDDNTPEKRVERIFEIMDTVRYELLRYAISNWQDNSLVTLTLVILYRAKKDRTILRANMIFDSCLCQFNLVPFIFSYLLQDNNGSLSKEEFLEGAKKDQSIVQALSLYDGIV